MITNILIGIIIFDVTIGIFFFMGERISVKYPTSKFAIWWDKHVAHTLDPDDPNF